MKIKLTDFFAIKYSQLSGGNISAKRAISLAEKIKGVSNVPTQLLQSLEKKAGKHPELKINAILSEYKFKNHVNLHQTKAKDKGEAVSRCHFGKHKSKINFNPSNAAPTEYTKAVSVESRKNSANELLYQTCGFISNVNATGEPGLRLHGMEGESCLTWEKNTSLENNPIKNSSVTIENGAYVITNPDASTYIVTSPEELHCYFLEVKNIDLKTVSQGKPLHLLSCFSNSEKSMAQSLANFLRRVVVGYGDGGMIYTCDIKEHLYEKNSMARDYNDNNIMNLTEAAIEQGENVIPARKIYYFPEKIQERLI